MHPPKLHLLQNAVLEGEHLATLCKCRLEFAQRRSGSCRQYKLGGLVVHDARIACGAQHRSFQCGAP
jgi:hypothetical protein